MFSAHLNRGGVWDHGGVYFYIWIAFPSAVGGGGWLVVDKGEIFRLIICGTIIIIIYVQIIIIYTNVDA